MSSGSSQEKIPFEPRQKKKKAKSSETQAKTQSSQKVAPQKVESKSSESNVKKAEKRKKDTPKNKQNSSDASLSAIPEEVSKRMVKRMAVFSGVPTFLGFLSFIAFYLVVSKGGIEIPSVAVLIVSIIFFGSGFLGLSYGIFSTSWDENYTGSVLGIEEFRLNFGRTVSAWRESRKEAKRNKNK